MAVFTLFINTDDSTLINLEDNSFNGGLAIKVHRRKFNKIQEEYWRHKCNKHLP